MSAVKINISGIADLDSAAEVLRALSSVPGVTGVGVSLGEATVDMENMVQDDLVRAIALGGKYRGEIVPPLGESIQHGNSWQPFRNAVKNFVAALF